MLRVIHQRMRTYQNFSIFSVEIEIYFFSVSIDHDLCKSVGSVGCKALATLLAKDRRLTKEVLIVWDEAQIPSHHVLSPGTCVLRPRMCQIDSAGSHGSPVARAIMSKALDEASKHLLRDIVLKSNARCRTIVLADTAPAARGQTKLAQNQSIVREGGDNHYKEEPLLAIEEDALIFHLVDFVPHVANLLELTDGEHDLRTWDPWTEWLADYVEESMRVHRSSVREQVENAGLEVPSAKDIVAFELYSLRRKLHKTDAVYAKCWSTATPLERLKIAWLCTREDPDVSFDFGHLQSLVEYWRCHPGEDWSPMLADVWPEDLELARNLKQSLVDQIHIEVGPHAPKPNDEILDSTAVVRDARKTALCFRRREDVFERRVNNELQLLRHLYSSYPKPDLLIPYDLRARSIALTFLKMPQISLDKRWKFLWFAVIGTESAEEVSDFLEELHRGLWECGRGIEDVRLCVLGRFWAASLRSSKYRRSGVNKRNDPMMLADISSWLHNLPEPTWYLHVKDDSGKREQSKCRTFWKRALDDEAHYFNSLEYSAQHKNSRTRVRANSFAGTQWHLYSTHDRGKHKHGLHFSLEMLYRNMCVISNAVATCAKKGLLAAASECRLLVSGALSCRFWPLLESARGFTVVQLGFSPFQSRLATNSSKSPISSRRRLYQQDSVTLEASLAIPANCVEDGRFEKMKKAIRLALHQVLNDGLLPTKDLDQTLTSAKGWWLAVENMPDNFRVRGLGVLLDNEWESTVIAPIARFVSELEANEEQCRSHFPTVYASTLSEIWLRRLSLALQHSAILACCGPGAPCVTFLETLAETLQRGNNEPLLRFSAQQRDLKLICKGHCGDLLYSREIKVLVERVLAPACAGPAGTLCLVNWVFSNADVLPLILKAHDYGPTSKDFFWFRIYWKEYSTPTNAKSRSIQLSVPQQGLSSMISPCAHSPYSESVHRRQIGFVSAVICRERLYHAQQFLCNLATDHNEERRMKALRVFTESHLRCFSGNHIASSKCARTQEHVSMELDNAKRRADAVASSTVLEAGPTGEHQLRAAGLKQCRHAEVPELSYLIQNSRLIYDNFFAGYEWQLSLSDAVHCVRCFCAHYILPRWTNMVGAKRELRGCEENTILENMRHCTTYVAARKYCLTGAIAYRSTHFEDLAALLDDVMRYSQQYGEDLLGGPFKNVHRSASSLRSLLTPHKNRTPTEKVADALLRRKQTESFAEIMRDLYCDRPRSKGVLDAFGHRIWGVGADMWTAEGERIQPSAAVLRALRSDPVAEAWNEAFATRDKLPQDYQHDRERSDAELARDVLCDPTNRGVRNDHGDIVRMRRSWKANPKRLGYAAALDVEKTAGFASSCLGGAIDAKLGAHEIHQPVLRRLVAVENVPQVAWFACLLRAPLLHGAPSHLALAQCPYMKRALEPLTHSIELWPLFVLRFSLTDFDCDASLISAFAREGAPVPRASCVAAHHWFLGANTDYDFNTACDALLQKMRNALQVGEWPKPWKPSPIWDEKDLRGKKQSASSTSVCKYSISMCKEDALHLESFLESSENDWFAANDLLTYFSQSNRAKDWVLHQSRHSRALRRLCRPPERFNRRNWILHYELPFTPWCDTGIMPVNMRLSAPRLDHPAVLSARSAGRKVQAGSLLFGPYNRKDYHRHIGDIGECILFGQRQQMLLRTLQQRSGLLFIAVNQDRQSMLREFLTQACVLYLLGRWLYFPIFHGEGKCRFPWLGPHWHKGVGLVQKLVRRRLRDVLDEAECSKPVSTLRSLHPKREAATLFELRDFSCEIENAPQIPELALRVEEVQRNAYHIHHHQIQTRTGSAIFVAPTREDLDGTLADCRSSTEQALLVFPTLDLIRSRCSQALGHGGFLAPRDLGKWMELSVVTCEAWPEVGDLLEHGNARVAPPPQPVKRPRNNFFGDHIVVLPNWAHYMRGLTERVGKSPRDSPIAWECSVDNEPLPPLKHPLYSVFLHIRLQGGYFSERKVMTLIGRSLESRGRCRGRREEAERSGSHPDASVHIPSDVVLHSSQSVRKWLESPLNAPYVKVRSAHDLRQHREIRGASICVREARLARARRLVAAGKQSREVYSQIIASGALYLHGCRAPGRGGTFSSQYVNEFGGGQRSLDGEYREAAAELREERAHAAQRTREELARPRWPSSAPLLEQLHGASWSASPKTLADADASGYQVVLVAGRASDFEADVVRSVCGCIPNAPLLALFPPVPKKPCYELQVASIHLMQRQLGVLYRNCKLLILGVGSEAQAIFADMQTIINNPESDAVALSTEDEVEILPEKGSIDWQLPLLTSFATLRQLQDKHKYKKLASGFLGEEWQALHLMLQAVLRQKRKRETQ